MPQSNSDTRLILFHYFEKSHAILLAAHTAAHVTLDYNTILSDSVFQQLIFGRADAQGMDLGSSLVDLIACLLVSGRAVITHERALCNSQLCRPLLGCGEHVRIAEPTQETLRKNEKEWLYCVGLGWGDQCNKMFVSSVEGCTLCRGLQVLEAVTMLGVGGSSTALGVLL